jgi:trk system potassium uptake protein
MKFIIIGLGNFGSALAEKLTHMGHEVIGVDNQIQKIQDIKDKITQAICLDSTHEDSVKSLPLKNTDVVVVSIGEDEGANILTTALMKKMNVPRLISRSVSPLHENVLQAMEVTEIVRPEAESAERWAKKLSSPGILDSYELTSKYSIVKARVTREFSGKTVQEVGFLRNFNVIVLTVIKDSKRKNIFGFLKNVAELEIDKIANADTVLNEGDIMVLYGHGSDIQKILGLQISQ